MNKYEKNIRELLHMSGAVLVRNGRHKVFRLEDGRNFITSKTPSSQGAARKSLAMLRRLLEPVRSERIEKRAEPTTLTKQRPQQRFVTPNDPQRERGEILISGLSTSEDKAHIESRDASIHITNIVELLMAADRSDLFWELDPCGRIRALTLIAQRFAKVEILPAQFCTASVSEIHQHFASSLEQDQSLEAITRREGPLYLRTLREWGGFTGIPSMLVLDPLLGKVLVEASAWSLLENTNYLFFWYGELWGSSYGIASQVWDSEDPTKPSNASDTPDHFIYSTFITRPMMKRKKFALQSYKRVQVGPIQRARVRLYVRF